MLFIRSLSFELFRILWTALLGLALVCIAWIPAVWRTPYIPRLWTSGMLNALRICCGIHYHVEGVEHIQHGGATIYAIKHQSAWETLILWHILDCPVFILKQELLRIPIFGYYLRKTPIIAIDRSAGSRAIAGMVAQARKHLQQQRQIIIFPEGTRTRPGQKIKYRSGVASLYANLDASVIPVALNSGCFWPRNGFIKRPGTITIRFMPPIASGLEKAEFMAIVESSIESASDELAAPYTTTGATDAA